MRLLTKSVQFEFKIFLIIMVSLYICIPVFAQSEAPKKTIQIRKEKKERIAQSSVWRVGIITAPPFSYKDNNGEWVGISVILWRLVANDIGLNYKFEEHDLNEILDGVSRGDLDAAVGPFTITAEREKLFDFTHSFFNTGLGVVVKKNPDRTIGPVLRQLIRGGGLHTIVVVLLSLMIIAVLIFFCERRYIKYKPDKALEARGNFWSSLWWSLVILIGKNDRHPASLGGKILALLMNDNYN